MTVRLNPCPFCQSENVRLVEMPEDESLGYAQCEDCEVKGPLGGLTWAAACWNLLARGEVVELPRTSDGIAIRPQDPVVDVETGGLGTVEELWYHSDAWETVVQWESGAKTMADPDELASGGAFTWEMAERYICHLVMSECIEDPEGDVRRVMARLKELAGGVTE